MILLVEVKIYWETPIISLNQKNLWTPQNNNGSYIFGDFQRTNQYDAKSRTTAAFVSAELKLNDTWKSVIGLRFENYIVKYTGESLEQDIFDNEELINVNDFFPFVKCDKKP